MKKRSLQGRITAFILTLCLAAVARHAKSEKRKNAE